MQGSYTSKTKIGNWREEQEQEKARIKEYLKKKEKGLLTTQQLASYTEKISLSKCDDGNLHDGDLIMLCSAHNKGILSVDLGIELPGLPTRFASSTAPSSLPCARNVFVVKKAPGGVSNSPIVCYGDKVVICTTNHLKTAASTRYDQLYLSSQLVTPFIFAKCTRYQEVTLSTTPSSDFGNHWQIQFHDPKFRVEAEGTPVQVGKPVILNHCKTNAHLGSSDAIYTNDFGNENEVFCHTILDQHKAEQLENLWTFEDGHLRQVD